MNIIVDRFEKIKSNIKHNTAKIIAVSKTYTLDYIKPLIDHGHVHFGENKVQEADSKWSIFKNQNRNIQLHMIGKLQSNKAKKAVELFDYIHSVDNEKLALTLSKCEKAINRKLKYFIQVNVGMENQKSGIPINQLDQFYNYCLKEINLDVIGLMAIPPNDADVEKHFKYLYETNLSFGLEELSMGMSADYMCAVKYKSTFVRIGSAIFGKRD